MLASVLHFYSGKLLQIHSGVDTSGAIYPLKWKPPRSRPVKEIAQTDNINAFYVSRFCA